MHLIHPAVFESEMSEADEVWVIGLAPDFLQKPLIGRRSAIVVLMGEMQEHLRNNLQLLFEELAEPETNWELVQPLLTVTLEMIRKPIARAEAHYGLRIAKGSERRIPMGLSGRRVMRRTIMPRERFKAGGEDVRRQLEAVYF